MDVFDEQEQGCRLARTHRQIAKRLKRPPFARGSAHRRSQRPQPWRRRHIDQVIEEQLVLGGNSLGCGRAPDRFSALGFFGVGGKAEQAPGETADRVAPGLGPEVENGRAVAREAERLRNATKLGDEARLADPRVAADDDDAAALSLGAGFGEGREFAQFLVPSDERAAGRLRRVPLAANPVGHERPLLALHLDWSAGLAGEDIGHLAPGVGADDDLAGRGQAAQAGRGVDGVAGQRVVTGARVAAASDDQTGVDAGVHGQRPAEAGDDRFDDAM